MDHEALLRDALVIDSHNDSIVAHIRRGNLSLERGAEGTVQRHSGTIAFLRGHEDPRQGAAYIQINFPLMRRAGIDAAFFAIDVTLAFQNHLAYALDGIGYFLSDIESSAANVVIVRRADDITSAKASGALAAVLALENADCTERSLNILDTLYRLGVRSIGLTHNVSSWAADGCHEGRSGTGLTRYGTAMVREMNRLGMLVDLAHVSVGAFFDGIEVSDKPVIFSHGNAHALCPHPRNLTDHQLRALRENGGVIGLSYVPEFVDSDDPTMERLLDHVDHIAGVAGIETVGLGGDFDGGGVLLADASETPLIVDGLIRRGYSDSDIRKVLGENTLRVLRAAIG